MKKNDFYSTFFEKLWGIRNIEISDTKYVFHENIGNILKTNKELHILWWIKDQKKWRSGINNISFKTYFIVDFDIREEYKKVYNEIINEDKLLLYIEWIKELFSKDEYLTEWSYIVLSWNGCHIYYCWEKLNISKKFSAESYKTSVKIIYDEIINYIRWSVLNELDFIIPDYNCASISHMIRLPWSINKKHKYWFWDIQTKVLFEQDIDSRLVSLLPQLAIISKKKPFSWSNVLVNKNKKKLTKNNYKKDIDVNKYSIKDVVNKYLWKDVWKDSFSCPFPGHTDKNPSFWISESKNMFTCWSKCWSWNPANFIEKIEWISYKDAIQKLANEF